MANELWVEPPSCNFKHNQEDQLKTTLEDLDKHLILSPINLPQDVALDAEANVGSGSVKYKLTRWAMFQLCQFTCPSMYGFATELSGVERAKESLREEYSFSEAIEIINRVVRRRFRTKMSGKIALVNGYHKTIDGFVSSSYRSLPNRELYTRASSIMQQLDHPATFFEATLVGRWLLLRFVDTNPLVTLKEADGIDERFYTGYHFSNNEVGKSSVKAAVTLYRKFSKSAAISPIVDKDTALRHVGLKFVARFDQLIKGMLTRRHDPQVYLAGIRMMQSTGLGLGNKSAKAERKRMEDIAAKLVRRGIPASIARVVVENVTRQSSYDEAPVEAVLQRPTDRTVFDLYNALGRCAIDLPINHRERTEQAAYAILMGKVAFD
jgi:hypothetical protein